MSRSSRYRMAPCLAMTVLLLLSGQSLGAGSPAGTAAAAATDSGKVSANELLSILAYMQKTANALAKETPEEVAKEDLITKQIGACAQSVKPATILDSFGQDAKGDRHLQPNQPAAKQQQQSSSTTSPSSSTGGSKLLTIVTGPEASKLARTFFLVSKRVDTNRRVTALRGQAATAPPPTSSSISSHNVSVNLATVAPTPQCLLASQSVSSQYRSGKIPLYAITLPADIQSEHGMLCSEYRGGKKGEQDVVVCVKRTVENGLVRGVVSNTGTAELCGATVSVLMPTDWEAHDGAAQVVQELDMLVGTGISASFEIPVGDEATGGLYGLTVDPAFGAECQLHGESRRHRGRQRRTLSASGPATKPEGGALAAEAARRKSTAALTRKLASKPSLIEKEAVKFVSGIIRHKVNKLFKTRLTGKELIEKGVWRPSS